MAAPNIFDQPMTEILRNRGTEGITATDLLLAVQGVGTRTGAQFAIKRMWDQGLIERRFEWTFWETGKPRARVYRYWLAEFAPREIETRG